MNTAPPSSRPASASQLLDFLALIAISGILILIATAVWGVSPKDLSVYHDAVRHLASDDVYGFDYQGLPFAYPPSALIAMAPVGVALPAARILMFVCSVAAVVATVRLTVRSSAPGSAWDRVGAVAVLSGLTMMTWPFLLGSALGQIAPIVMGLTAVAVLGRRSRWNGVWLGTAVAIKLTPAAFWLYWGAIGRWRATLVSISTFLAWAVAAAVIMPQSTWWYFGEGGMVRAEQDYSYTDNQALMGVAVRALGDEPMVRVGAVAVSSMALLVAVAVAKRLRDAGWAAVAVSLVGVWSGIATPLGWTHAFVWWAPLAIALYLSGRTRTDRAAGVLVYLAPFLVLLGPPDAPSPVSGLEQVRGATYLVIGVAVTAYLSWRVRSAPLCVAEPDLAPGPSQG